MINRDMTPEHRKELRDMVASERTRLFKCFDDAPCETLSEFIKQCNEIRVRPQSDTFRVSVDSMSARVMAVASLILISEWTDEVLK